MDLKKVDVLLHKARYCAVCANLRSLSHFVWKEVNLFYGGQSFDFSIMRSTLPCCRMHGDFDSVFLVDVELCLL